MYQYVIRGGNPLAGEVNISGAKNAALAILAAAIMTDDTVVIDNLPNVSDVNVLIDSIEGIGATVKHIDNHTVSICGATISSVVVDYDAIKKCPLEKRHKGNQGSRTKRRYKDIICAIDIETSRVSEDESIMYIWQAQVGDSTVVGRSWKECGRFFKALAGCCGKDEAIVIFVHNLSFEFAYLAGLYHFSPAEVFAVSSRKVLKCEMYGCLEFRCSYLHSNMSLDEYTHKMGVEHAKLSGFDYDVVRYPWTKLTADELAYCVHDVQGLCEAIKIEMAHDGDNIHSFPLTSTGYVRRDVKKAMKYVSYGFIKKQLPSWPVYVLLRQAFRGGNTHCNRYFN